ncbi:hypothetical protein L596_030626 [Steinernema carpocapsae]|uniref:Uncharacterized protein n=1 Tax=Steinernema carpocapsae TaxID=34508 RepID=A0A4U5LPY2_STECR|nr:hypothetical protein L596_030626 [Steinernema carpocapsae]
MKLLGLSTLLLALLLTSALAAPSGLRSDDAQLQEFSILDVSVPPSLDASDYFASFTNVPHSSHAASQRFKRRATICILFICF